MKDSLIERFEADLKTRIDQRTVSGKTPSKTLLESFKYFDLQNSNITTLGMFWQMAQFRLGITQFSESEKKSIFAFYSRGVSYFDYRKFIGELYSDADNKSLFGGVTANSRSKSPMKSQNEMLPAQYSNAHAKIKSKIASTLAANEIFFFLKLNNLLEDRLRNGDLSTSDFIKACSEVRVNLNLIEVESSFIGRYRNGRVFNLDGLFADLCDNYTPLRHDIVKRNLTDPKSVASKNFGVELISAALKDNELTIDVKGYRNGNLTKVSLENLFQQGARILSASKSATLNPNSVVRFFMFTSPYFKADEDFKEFIEFISRICTPPESDGLSTNQNHKQVGQVNNLTSKIVIAKTENFDSEDVYISYLANLLDSQGSKGYVNLCWQMKICDSDRDGLLTYNELQRALLGVGITLTNAQLAGLALKTGNAKIVGLIDYKKLMELLVPRFSQEKLDILNHFYSKLLFEDYGPELSFSKLTYAYSPREYTNKSVRSKSGILLKLDTRAEFSSALQKFLMAYIGETLIVPNFALIRFFEFYAKGWPVEDLLKFLSDNFVFKQEGSIQSMDNYEVASWTSMMEHKKNRYRP